MSRLFVIFLGLIVFTACEEPRPDPKAELAELERKLESQVLKENSQVALGLTSFVDPALVKTVNEKRAEQGLQPRSQADYLTRSFSRYPVEPLNRERYAKIGANLIQRVSHEPVSTFSIDVDTASYSNVRRMLEAGTLPPGNAVRVEEIINHFDYEYSAPESRDTPFQVNTEVGPTPWNPNTHLLQIGIKGYDVNWQQAPPANLVFLIDVSGSMRSDNKLPLVKRSVQLLTRQLRREDSVAIVVYAGAAGLVLPATSGDQRGRIIAAISALEAGGSTNGAQGIRLAYEVATDSYAPEGVNRVIIATDGDLNVGVTNVDDLKDMVARYRETGISLTTLGFGTGNYNSELMESLADIGDGNAAYVDNLNEARRALVQNMSGTLLTIADDVKIQVEFSPLVSEYRLIGYENRLLNEEDFNNDKVDAGEVGAGHSVTALYEIALAGGYGERLVSRRYAPESVLPDNDYLTELAFVKLRYKQPGTRRSIETSMPVSADSIKLNLADTSDNFRFAAAAAAFGQQLRGGTYLSDFNYTAIRQLAAGARGDDPHGDRNGMLALIQLAESLTPDTRVSRLQ